METRKKISLEFCRLLPKSVVPENYSNIEHEMVDGTGYYLCEHDDYGDMVSAIVINEDGTVIGYTHDTLHEFLKTIFEELD